MRFFILLVILLGCFAVGFRSSDQPAPAVPAVQQNEANIGFEWAFGALVGKEKTMVPVTHDTTLKTGDEIKMMVKLTKDCYVYVIYQGSKGEVNLLFPYEIRQFQADYKAEKNYYVPKGRPWIALDKNTGKEVFFLVASTERLLDLEVKLGNYLSADDTKKQLLAGDVISEIRSVRKRYSTFSTLAEKPVTIGGNIRGTEKVEKARRPDVATIATQISANNFYSKTITIDHQ
ncbi:MAG: DUF4384 domain-containing protein [Ignavibacteriae bacterium]|nr:MAG: DUF4384 domain-containing protein [Ignavibacteriota bacterium]